MGRAARRLILARTVVGRRLRPQDPLAMEKRGAAAIDAILVDGPVDLVTAQALVAARSPVHER